MQLHPSQVSEVVNFLRKFPAVECQVCHHEDWTVSTIVFSLPEYRDPLSPGLGPAQREVFPVIPVTCSTCGHVFFLSAVATGVLKR
jgi:ribosomal protein S27E